MIDSSGSVVESFTYDNHYGAIISHTKSVETNNPYGYTGRKIDTPDLYYYRARYYDPTIKRFLSEDPIGFASGDFNWYRYVGNRPNGLADPFGLQQTCFTISNGSEWVTVEIIKIQIVPTTYSALGFAICRWHKERIERGYTLYHKIQYCIDCNDVSCNPVFPCSITKRDVSTRGKTTNRVVNEETRTNFTGCINADPRVVDGSTAIGICPNPFGGKSHVFKCNGPKDIRKPGDPTKNKF